MTEPYETSASSRRLASGELKSLLEKVSGELEQQTKQFAFLTRLDFLIQFSAVAAVFVLIMTLLGNAWVGVFLVIIICCLLLGLRWLQVQLVLTSIDKIREILK